MFGASLEIAVCVGGVVGFIFLLAFLVLKLYLNYRETMALAEKGLVRPQAETKDGKHTLCAGIITTSIGVALTLSLWSIDWRGGRYPLGSGLWMIVGLLPMFVGLALILIYILTHEPKDKEK